MEHSHSPSTGGSSPGRTLVGLPSDPISQTDACNNAIKLSVRYWISSQEYQDSDPSLIQSRVVTCQLCYEFAGQE